MPAAFPSPAALANAADTAARTGCVVVLTKGEVRVEVLPPAHQSAHRQAGTREGNTCDGLFGEASG